MARIAEEVSEWKSGAEWRTEMNWEEVSENPKFP
jgi:hypothetical protein